MSAYDDIRRALACHGGPKQPSCIRFILIGPSAERSIATAVEIGSAPDYAMHDIAGCQVMRAPEGIRGWTVRDRDARGQWFDLDGRPESHPDFDSTSLLRLDRAG